MRISDYTELKVGRKYRIIYMSGYDEPKICKLVSSDTSKFTFEYEGEQIRIPKEFLNNDLVFIYDISIQVQDIDFDQNKMLLSTLDYIIQSTDGITYGVRHKHQKPDECFILVTDLYGKIHIVSEAIPFDEIGKINHRYYVSEDGEMVYSSPEDCNHLDENLQPLFMPCASNKLICLRCGKIINVKRNVGTGRRAEAISNDLVLHAEREMKFLCDFKDINLTSDEIKMINYRMLKIYIDDKQNPVSKYCCVAVNLNELHVYTYKNILKSRKPVGFEFIYDDEIFKRPYIIGIRIKTVE